ncbi:tig peptidyl-prolyl cis/trans isomerase (trigger factor) [Serratia symbiotica str. 'Cinara cedri']|nr:tig peptidyl-prolyl cis/trans isomerase (trigger factor) [Serratia symbiotica str. 'Cinara cedri']
MQVSLVTTQGLGRRLSITVPAESISEAVNNKLIHAIKNISIDGFRKGKVPRKIIEQRYRSSISKDVLNETMRCCFIDTITKENIHPAGAPNYLAGEYREGKDFNFVIEFEVYPDIKLKNLKNIEIEMPVVEVTDNDIDTMIKTLRTQQATWQISNDTTKTGDRVTIRFTSSIENEAFEGARDSDFILVIGQGRMMTDFEEGLIGHNAGEEFIIDAYCPEDCHAKNLKSKKAKFTIFLKKVEKRELPELNKDFIKYFGVTDGSIDSLRKEVSKNMERELKWAVRNRIKTQVINSLISANNIAIPSVIISNEINILRDEIAQQFHGNKQHTLKVSNELLEEQARKRVAIRLLLNTVVSDNNLQVDEKRVKTLIQDIASAYDDPNVVITLYSKNKDLMNNIRNIALEEQAIEALLITAKVIEKAFTFNEIMNQHQ